ncbi:alpha/beta fold hydrolase [Streptomyces sp. NRRL B-1677]|uniref:Thioesterase n=1 Tax=Streptomyces klenkii TaxID=1420899 RepID=A0A3B0BM79_9ACTN|nr:MULTISPECIES: alpha/beta fold hydrolase [Streptomyces]MBF6046461.1 alpha/beta fold hydrolase [Streptomyces sp. NRRL B-1677]RKN74663.1 thioesterase [Streptomyces klenkii]
MVVDDKKWIRRFHPADEAPVRLACLPHAGGAASYFFPVSKALSPSVEVLAVQYPGRQDRRADPCIENLAELADRTAEALAPATDRPLALFGHSMGATLAYEVALRLEERGTTPVALFVSGRRAPSRHREETVHERTDEGLVEELRRLSGTDAQMLDDPDILELVLPALRADYRAIETHRARPGLRVGCPVHALTGDADPRATPDEVQDWQHHTTGAFTISVFPGGHFYLNDHQQEIAKIISSALVYGAPLGSV